MKKLLMVALLGLISFKAVAACSSCNSGCPVKEKQVQKSKCESGCWGSCNSKNHNS